MNIAIIGAGNVGGTLGKRFAEQGHQITFGTAHPEGNEKPVSEGAKSADVIVLAVPYSAVDDAVKACGNVSGKLIIDCTNPIKSDFSGVIDVQEGSGAEHVARIANEARVVKAFNTIGNNIMANPKFPNGNATLLYCGNDENAKKEVHQLAQSIGFKPVDAGPLSQAKYLEHFAWVWISLAMKYGQGREIVFQLEKR